MLMLSTHHGNELSPITHMEQICGLASKLYGPAQRGWGPPKPKWRCQDLFPWPFYVCIYICLYIYFFFIKPRRGIVSWKTGGLWSRVFLCLRASECIKSERMCLCNPIGSWKPCGGLHAADISCVNKNSIHPRKTASWSGLTGRVPKGGPFFGKELWFFGGTSDCLFGLPLIVFSSAW